MVGGGVRVAPALVLSLDAAMYTDLTTVVSQNIAGAADATGLFFRPNDPTYASIAPGWYVVGQPTWIVTAVNCNPADQYSTSVTISGGVFQSGQSYAFTNSGLWLDQSGYNHTATLVGSTPYTSAGNLSYFSFSSGVAQCPAILSNTSYTKIGIFRVAGSFGNLISGGVSDVDHAFWGFDTPFIQSGHNGAWNTIIGGAVPANQWAFAAVTFNTVTGWRLFLNDNTVVTNPNTAPFTPNPSIVEIGGYGGNGNYLNGDVALVQVYNAALTDLQVRNIFLQYQSRFGY